ncbi:ABC transporter permease [Actinomadura atramentaria]|uniref:ABC transporter permease n=1 Tax=Actinomadura atramentaria TaxID=1990 RepID=UPI00036B28FF|nr:ABC transporter permease subunit [Actinomadura atramentaria]
MTAVLRFLGSTLLAAVLVVVLWTAFLLAFPQIGPRVGKTPLDVWTYLSVAENRGPVLSGLGTTLADAATGFAAGMCAALAAAALSLLWRGFAHTAVPVATLLRSIPLVTMTPLVVLVVGRGTAAVAVMGGLVVFFPAFVVVTAALRDAPAQALDLVRAYGGGRGTALRRVALPWAVPALFAAARISVPGALVGALIAEWLGTGKGLGSAMIRAIPLYDYDRLWASIVAVTAASILVYALVGALERLVADRLGQ